MSNDYLLRYIEDMTRALAQALMMKKPGIHEEIVTEDGGFSSEGFLRYALKKLVLEGKINEAENLLFETLEAEPLPAHLPVALDFYGQLAAMSDDDLHKAEFSREEIADGLKELSHFFDAGLLEELSAGEDTLTTG